MRIGFRPLNVRLVLSAAVFGFALAARPALAVIPPYTLVGSYSENGLWDVAPDGRLYTLSGSSILRQSSVNGAAFVQVGTVPAGLLNSFGASFLRISPDGSKIAIGDGNFAGAVHTYIVDAAPLNTAIPSSTPISILSTLNAPNYDATWDGNTRLYISGARVSDGTSIVSRVDLTTAAVGTVLTNVGGASAGVALRNGLLYAASGYLPTGEIRSFDVATLSTVSPGSFSSGTLVGSILSASPLDFDAAGNLLVGGGDAFSGTSAIGYAAIVDLNDPTHPLHISPAGVLTTYAVRFNHASGELLVQDAATSIVYRYAVPAPASVALLGLSGILAARRRRHA